MSRSVISIAHVRGDHPEGDLLARGERPEQEIPAARHVIVAAHRGMRAAPPREIGEPGRADLHVERVGEVRMPAAHDEPLDRRQGIVRVPLAQRRLAFPDVHG